MAKRTRREKRTVARGVGRATFPRADRVREQPARASAPTVSTTMRLKASVRQGLEALAGRSRRSVSEVAQQLLEEGVRMQECPGIYFATEPSGRTAKVMGTGLGVGGRPGPRP